MRTSARLLLLLATLLPAIGLAQAGGVVAEGDLVVGTPLYALDGVNALYFEAPPGTVVSTSTTTTSPLGFDMDIVFFDELGVGMEESCRSPAPEETCTVPEGADLMAAHAYRGASLHVVVRAG